MMRVVERLAQLSQADYAIQVMRHGQPLSKNSRLARTGLLNTVKVIASPIGRDSVSWDIILIYYNKQHTSNGVSRNYWSKNNCRPEWVKVDLICYKKWIKVGIIHKLFLDGYCILTYLCENVEMQTEIIPDSKAKLSHHPSALNRHRPFKSPSRSWIVPWIAGSSDHSGISECSSALLGHLRFCTPMLYVKPRERERDLEAPLSTLPRASRLEIGYYRRSNYQFSASRTSECLCRSPL